MSRRFSQIELPLLLPDDPGERSRRLGRMQMHVRSLPGVRAVEVVDERRQPILRLEIDQRSTPLASVERLARHAGVELRQRFGSVVFTVEGMASPQSEEAIEGALAGLPGVHATASFPSKTLRVEFDRTRCQLPDVAVRLAKMGFRIAPGRSEVRRPPGPLERLRMLDVSRAVAWARAHPQPMTTALGALALIVGFILEKTGAPLVVTTPVYLVSYCLAGWHTARDTFLTLLRGKFNIDVLMFVAAIGAGVLNHWAEGALLLVLFAVGHAGEDLAMQRARKAFQALYEVAPDSAMRKSADGSLENVRVEELTVGDTIVVRPGDRVAADGSVILGVSSVDQAAITGESTPVEKAPGSRVLAGTMNGDGSLEVRVEKLASESTIARAIRLVEEAQTQKSPTEMFTDAVERRYVPLVLVATACLMVIPPLVVGSSFEVWKTWFYRSMAFLTAASPCALAIGTPAAMLSALARSARMGLLIKGGSHIETLGRLRTMCFDKTGTLTRGKPRVVGVTAFDGASESEVLALAAAIEASSAHPLAHAVMEAARAQGWDGRAGSEVEQVVGKGLRGRVGGALVEVGSLKLYEGMPGADGLRAAVHAKEEAGATAVLVRRDNDFIGLVALADEPRADAKDALGALRAMGVDRLIMLTGDNERVARALAVKLGLDGHHASLLPEDKMKFIGDLVAQGRPVAMVGDGVNDAPALAAATVGIAMGAAGSDVALETADVALMHDDLSRIPQAVALSRFARRIITQNLVIALAVICVLAPLAAVGIANIGLAVLFHEGSTVVVVLNGLRLLRFRPRSGVSEARTDAPSGALPGAPAERESAYASV